jgi:hypothetical protein
LFLPRGQELNGGLVAEFILFPALHQMGPLHLEQFDGGEHVHNVFQFGTENGQTGEYYFDGI